MRPPEADAGVPVVAAGLPALTGPWPPTTRWPEPLHRAVRALGALPELHGGPAADAGRDSAPVLLAVSGGADSLALAVTAAVFADTRAGAAAGGADRFAAVTVDHRLQPGSADVARAAADVVRGVGLRRAAVVPVEDGDELGSGVRGRRGGVEAAARSGRYAALRRTAAEAGARLVLTAHTADDQAEQVLLALARGSGTRSLAGISVRGPLPSPDRGDRTAEPGASAEAGVDVARPLLGLTRADTERICRWAGVRWWDDPQNADPDVRRARVRHRLLPALEDEAAGLGPGLRAGLVRSAQVAAEDADALDAWADREFAALLVTDRGEAGPDGLSGAAPPVGLRLDGLRVLPPAVRHRVVLRAARQAGAEGLTRERLVAVTALVDAAPGASAGPVELPGGVRVWRSRPRAGRGESRARACATLEFIPTAQRPPMER